MGRPRTLGLTAGEARIMHVLWDVGESSVSEIRRHLPEDLAPSTVRTLLRILQRKRRVTRRRSGRSFVYRAAEERGSSQTIGVIELARRFMTTPGQLALHIIEDAPLTASELDQLEAALRRSREEREA